MHNLLSLYSSYSKGRFTHVLSVHTLIRTVVLSPQQVSFVMLSSAIKRIDTSVRQAERVYRDVLVRCVTVWAYYV